ncbi:MAG TPA: phosphate acyltransferase [Bacillota bacterium]|nr:phosphate butyryltransferase [Candidatus Fermentithermobacillaceae bacterium]HOB30801.1 phosphate acyltransferase [Bacillota bacterium]HOK64632.1 phosphate acyltransferase [Bacillota bacterium]HOL12115.1 phosphate acyltransferase [Bacillota bacterium]HOQ03229.1 phosphate acyltransferase [Bacillota bacterium]
MIYRDFAHIIERAKLSGRRGTAVVAGAHDLHVIEAIARASEEGLADAVLIGDAERIFRYLDSLSIDKSQYPVVHAVDQEDMCIKAVEYVRGESSGYLVKGVVETSELLRQVVNREHGLRTDRKMSHLAFYQIPSYPKVIVDTDGGVIPYPTLEEKKEIVLNAVETLHVLGYENPKIAALCPVEKVNPKIIETVDAAELKKMNLTGEITGCVIEGPISYDLAFSKEAAEIKNFDCPYSGDFDVVLVPNMAVGNIMGKSWSITAGALMAGIVVGAKVPVVITSRMSNAQERFTSLALACLISGRGAER